MTFTRVVNNWPTIELYFKLACDGQQSTSFNKSNFIIHENGLEVPDFSLWCPQGPCAMSTALVFDASGSMSGAGNAGAKAAGNAFVDMMDGTIDEATIIWFTSTVNIELGMTTNKTDLHDAVNSLPAAGATAVWDGMFVGLTELILSGSNPCRAVVAITDGGDNSSSHTPDEIIALANRNRIRVFTVGLGSVTPAQLETIALLTGGQYYQAPSASQLAPIFQEIFTKIRNGFDECVITYQAECKDGGVRQVDLTVKDFCHGGTDMRSRTYRAPKDTSQFQSVYLSAGTVESRKGDAVAVPLRLDVPSQTVQNMYPSTIRVTWDPGCISFDKFEARQGNILDGKAVAITPIANGIKIDVQERIVIDGSGVLGALHFIPVTNPVDSVTCAVNIETCVFEAGCWRVYLNDGAVKLYNSDLPYIAPQGSAQLCEGDSVRIVAADGFTDYLWSTGETTKSIWVSQSGTYSLTAKNGAGEVHTSNTVIVTVIPLPTPGIFPEGNVALCYGASLTIQSDGGYTKYLWSTGDTTQTIDITEPGRYHYMVRNEYGCWGNSEQVIVTRKSPNPEILGNLTLCGANAIAEFSVQPGASLEYKWTVGGATPLTRLDSSGVRIRVNGTTASITVEVYDPNTGCRVTDNKVAQVVTGPSRILMNAPQVICEGDSAELYVEPIYTSYEWNTGSTEYSIHAKTTGDYFCKVTNGGCTFYTDTVHITSMADITMAITGDNIVCKNGTATYSAPQIDGLDYWWRLEGESTDARSGNPATLQFAGGQTARVILRYGPAWCSDSVTLDVSLVEGLQPSVAIAGDSVVCFGDSIKLEAEAGFTDYRWSNGMTAQSIYVSQSGSYSVSAVGPNGCRGTSMEHTATVLPELPKPVLRVINGKIECNAPGYTYRWYLNGNLIPGATTIAIDLDESGTYMVEITGGNGCSAESDPFTAVGIGRYAPGLASEFTVSPNPTDGLFRVSLEFDRPITFTMQLTNVAGQVVYSEEIHQPVVSFQKTIRLSEATPGMYFLVLQSGNVYDFRKVIVQNR